MKNIEKLELAEIVILLHCKINKESNKHDKIHFDGYHHKETIVTEVSKDNHDKKKSTVGSVTFNVPFHSNHEWNCKSSKTGPKSCKGPMYAFFFCVAKVQLNWKIRVLWCMTEPILQ